MFEIRGGSGAIARADDFNVARAIADMAVRELGERIAIVWDETGASRYRTSAPLAKLREITARNVIAGDAIYEETSS